MSASFPHVASIANQGCSPKALESRKPISCGRAAPRGPLLPAAGIAIGGDVFPGSTLSDHCLRYQNIPDIKMIVVLGELGGQVSAPTHPILTPCTVP